MAISGSPVHTHSPGQWTTIGHVHWCSHWYHGTTPLVSGSSHSHIHTHTHKPSRSVSDHNAPYYKFGWGDKLTLWYACSFIMSRILSLSLRIEISTPVRCSFLATSL